jgi:hypothetical protein
MVPTLEMVEMYAKTWTTLRDTVNPPSTDGMASKAVSTATAVSDQ